MAIQNRVLIIGLDGATWDVLNPWIKDGLLPHLAELRQGGSWGVLLSTIPPLTAPAWSTFMTGKRPGKHGVFHFINVFEKGSATNGKREIVNARSLKSSTLWDILGHHERKVIVINVPMTYPPRPVNGAMITGLLTPRSASVFTYPPELSKGLKDYIIDLDRFIDVKPFQGTTEDSDPQVDPTLSLVREFHDMLDRRAETSLSLMSSQPWDLFTVVFTGPDRMGHYLWAYHHTPDERDDPATSQLCQAVQQYYTRLDEVVGELVEQAGNDACVLIMSDHGMGRKYNKRMHCNNWLHQQGWLATSNAGPRLTNPDTWVRRLGLSRDTLGRVIYRIPGLASSPLVKKATQSRALTPDLEHSQAYCIPMYNHVMGIRINLEGEKREALRQEIMQGLKLITDPETGQAVVQEVRKGEDYYHGPYAEGIPDILVIMQPDYGCSPELGTYSSPVTRFQFPREGGGHRMEGIFVAYGPQVRPNSEQVSGMALEDVVPTVLHLMGLPVPDDIDGRVLTEILTPGTLESRPILSTQPIGFWPSEDAPIFEDEAVSQEDDADIRKRLQALGYLE